MEEKKVVADQHPDMPPFLRGRGRGVSARDGRDGEKGPGRLSLALSVSPKDQFREILAHVSEGVLEAGPGGELLYGNPAALSLAGVRDHEISSKNLKDIFRDDELERMKGLVRNRDLGLEGDGRGLVTRLNGREIGVRPLQRVGGKGGLILILNDLTERKRMEVQLQEAQKMEAIATLAAGVAHDFNNLLMAIQGNASLMLLDTDESHPHRERLRTIEKQVQSGCQLTNQLLGYAMKGGHHARPLDLNRVAGEISDTFGRTRKEFVMRPDLADDLHPVEADQGQIEQVLLNLFINAADAMPGGGEISVSTLNASPEDPKGKMSDPNPRDYVLLRVADTGTGMDGKTIKRIFDPFFTTKGRGAGHGLGLASVYGIIRRHGGHIEVESEVGQGTRFDIYLPAAKGVARTAPDNEAAPGPDETGRCKGTVLSVDDEEIVRKVGCEMLEALGYQVLTARDGNEAIRVYKENRNRIDVVLLDMIMPRMGGLEVFNRLKEINPDIRVLLASGYSMEGKAREILERGCNAFIQKPFKIRDLSRTLRAVMEKDQTPRATREIPLTRSIRGF